MLDGWDDELHTKGTIFTEFRLYAAADYIYEKTVQRLLIDTINESIMLTVLDLELQATPNEYLDYATRINKGGVVDFIIGAYNASENSAWNRDALHLAAYHEEDSIYYGVFISGDPLNPTIIIEDGDFEQSDSELALDRLPPQNTVYTVVPTFSTGITETQAVALTSYWQNDLLHINISSTRRQQKMVSVTVINHLGQQLWSKELNDSKVAIPAKEWKYQGVLLITLDNGQVISRKF